MTTGFSIDTLSAADLSKLVLSLIIITIILHIIIQSVFAARTRGLENDLKDERDVRIERKGASYGFHILSIFLTIIIGHIVIQNGLDSLPDISEKHQAVFDYTNTSHLVFALITAAFLGDIIKNAVMLWAYRS